LVEVRKVTIKFRHNGTDLEVVDVNRASADMIDRYAPRNKAESQAASASLH
jgi:hypothetical protein